MNTFQCVCTSTRLVYKLQYILKMPKDSTTHTRPWNHRHIYIHTNSKITVTYSKFLSFQHQLPYIRAPNAKNAQKIVRTKKLSVIPDSATLFFPTSRPHALSSKTPSFISNSSLRVILRLTPPVKKRTLLSSAGICFNITVFIYISLVKRVKPKSAAITCECTTQLTHVPQARPFYSKHHIFHKGITCLV